MMDDGKDVRWARGAVCNPINGGLVFSNSDGLVEIVIFNYYQARKDLPEWPIDLDAERQYNEGELSFSRNILPSLESLPYFAAADILNSIATFTDNHNAKRVSSSDVFHYYDNFLLDWSDESPNFYIKHQNTSNPKKEIKMIMAHLPKVKHKIKNSKNGLIIPYKDKHLLEQVPYRYVVRYLNAARIQWALEHEDVWELANKRHSNTSNLTKSRRGLFRSPGRGNNQSIQQISKTLVKNADVADNTPLLESDDHAKSGCCCFK